jgi:NADPH2:quinone reductase
MGVFWGDFVKREPQASAAALGQLAQWYAEGKVRPVLDATLPMAGIHEAYARMAGRQVMGKIVLVNP